MSGTQSYQQLGTPGENTAKPAKYLRGMQLYSEGRFDEASATLEEVLREEATSEVANDWAAAELACGRTDNAEQGFTRALALDAGNIQAAANLGALLASLGRAQEAIPLLQNAAVHVDEGQRATVAQLLAACRNKVALDIRRESEVAFRGLVSDLHKHSARTKLQALPKVIPNVPSKIKQRPTDGWMVYKPDFIHVPVHAADLSGGHWEVKEEQAVATGQGASLRWSTVASKVYALLLHNAWSGKVASSVNGGLCDIVDLYSHGYYVEPLEIFSAPTTTAIELELTLVGRNTLAHNTQFSCFGFLVGREFDFTEPPRVETDEGFLAIQKQQLVNWLDAIKRRGASLEEVAQQRLSAYTLRISEAMAFMRPGSRVLDLGCGHVFKEILRDVILKRGIDYWLQDIDPEVCKGNGYRFSEQGLPAEHILCGDNTNFPYPDGHFNGVISSHCLEHSRDLSRTFSELHRILSPGGTLVFAVPRNWDRAEEHIYAPLPGGWEAFSERHGFQVISSNLGCYYGEGGENDLMVVANRN